MTDGLSGYRIMCSKVQKLKGIYHTRSMIIGSLETGSPTIVGVMMPKVFQCISLSESENLNDSIISDNTTSRKLENISKIDD